MTTVMKLLSDAGRLHASCIVVLDEIFGYRDFRQHEVLALWRWLRVTPRLSVQVIGTSTQRIDAKPTRDNPSQAGAVRLVATETCVD